jgi:uroporphyrinogen decarboxylase
MGMATTTADSLRPVDLERFWAQNEIGLADPFGAHIPRVPMHMHIGHHCAFAELGLPEDNKRVEDDPQFAHDMAVAYNRKAMAIVGRKFLNETLADPRKQFPRVRSVGEIFGCQRLWQSESWWLMEAAHTPEELSKLLDRVERLDVRSAMFPDNWESECRRIYEQFGLRPHLGKHLRGPVTLATSIYGSENLVYLIMDDPALAARLRDAILRVVLEYYAICDEVSDPAKVRRGFSFADDNCCLMTQDMYALFGQPILRAVYDRFAPQPGDSRYQHSDSDMGHLMPLLNETGMNRVNFGPRIRVRDIRAAMPHAVIEGQMAPFTFMRNNEEQIIAEVKRDCEDAMEKRGLVYATAGSVNDGSTLQSLRTIMWALEQYGWYRR